MACTSPVKGFRGAGGRLVVARKDSPTQVPLEVPCGRCASCRLARRRDWGVRAMHEASLHEDNSFLTLTYDAEHMPETGSLVRRDLQLFHKRLREAISPARVRFMACGEYGSRGDRPHYHEALFGYAFPDRQVFSKSKTGHLLYTSALLGRVWPLGHHWIGTLTRQSAAYIAGYVSKKVGGDAAVEHYSRLSLETGEVHLVQPEFLVCSNRPGIGAGFSDRWQDDWCESGFFVADGERVPVPRYYLRRLKSALGGPDVFEPCEVAAKERGVDARCARPEEHTDARREVRAEVLRLKEAQFNRDRVGLE